jgi:exosortase
MDTQTNDGILEEFRIEFQAAWQTLPNKYFFLGLLAAWVALFHYVGNSTLGYGASRSLLQTMYLVYNPHVDFENTVGDDAHGNVVPFVVLGLLWYKRKDLLASELRVWPPALAIVGFALLLHIVGYGVQQSRISILALFAGIYGLAGLAWGPEWLRKTFFPFWLFIFCVPLGSLTQSVTFPLRMLATRLVEMIAHNVLAIDVVREGTALFDPGHRYQYDVAAACSGIRSLIATFGLALIFGMISFRSWWKRVVVFASAFPLAVIGNMLRLLAIIIAAEVGGQKAGNAVHEGGPMGIYSLLPYVPAFLGLIWLGDWLRKLPPADPAPAPRNTPAREPLEAAHQPE